MKTIHIIKKVFLISSLSLSFYACDLEQLPQDKMVPENSLKTETELKMYINGLLPMLSGASDVSDGAATAAGIMMEKTDDVIWSSLPDYMTGRRSSTQSAGRWDWTNLRKINYFLKYSSNCPDEEARAKYNAMAYFLRAHFYYIKLKTFGGVPWYDTVLEDNSPELYKPRDSRETIADHILTDLNNAIAEGIEDKKLNEITKWTMLALKSRFCLFEGTFRKYHGIEGAEKFLSECVSASEAIMTQGKYSIDHGNGPEVAYRDLFAQPANNTASNKEVITAYAYNISLGVKHNTNYAITNPSGNQIGLSKALMNSYLMKDGTRFTDKDGYATMKFGEEFQNRDPRMLQTVRAPGYIRIGETGVVNNNMYASIIVSTTGYMPIKYEQSGEHDKQSSNDNDIILFRYAEVLLNFAEAKAELGTLTQPDLENSIKLIRARVGMGNIDMAAANADPDPILAEQYPLVKGDNKGVILEIRRERRVEMVMEGLRYDDIMRWKAGHLFTKPFYGVYFPEVTGNRKVYNMSKPTYNKDSWFYVYEGTRPSNLTDKNSVALNVGIFLSEGNSGYKVVNADKKKYWNEERDYLAPLPSNALVVNPNLKQNPHWDTPSN